MTASCPLRDQFTEARISGSTLHEVGTGTRATLRPQKGETIEVYELDTAKGRKALGLTAKDTCADGAMWLPRKPLLLIVELKGGRAEDAVHQLDRTLAALRKKAATHGCATLHVRAVLVNRGSIGNGLEYTRAARKFMREHDVVLTRHTMPKSKSMSFDLRRALD